MNKLHFFILLSVACWAQGLKAEVFTYPIGDVETLEITGGIEFNIVCGEVNQLDISADTEDAFIMSLTDKNLKIKSSKEGFWNLLSSNISPVSAELMVTRPPQTIDVSAGSEVEMPNCYKNQGNLDLAVHAGSSFTIKGEAGSIDRLEVDISSGSEVGITASLEINHLNLEASSGAEFNTRKSVVINNASVKISSGASAEICGTLAISGRASSGGEVNVSEAAKLSDIRTNSGGSIEPNC
ncbi:MAG TPA: hypothetical protein EYQ22_01100 [Gammaproteobacteria bacterium]|mgnify:CR=1 FL=1|nr:hypothetical protein [Gammaproteobacteria bacterium]|tara:strand:+ start:56 stop:775 length:720 start_codon:yes stop_codon:yes gene_type:complete